MTLKDAALDYAREGLAVFPCGDDKAPLIEGGFKSASADEAQVAAWWDEHPDALIGVPVPAGHVVVDMDPRNGGKETMAQLFAEHTDSGFKTTRRAKTRGGGVHYWFTTDAPADARFRKVLGPGVDVKPAGRGYVIAPPSPGYSWTLDVAPRPLPAWAAASIQKREAPAPTVAVASGPRFFAFEEGTRYGIAARDRELGRLLSALPGTRNESLNAAAFACGQLVAGGELAADETLQRLHEVAERIGLEPHEVEGTVRSGWEAGMREPRSAPELEDSGAPAPRPARASYRTDGGDPVIWLNWSADEPAPPFYLAPLLPVNAYVLVYGPTEASKSMTWNGILINGSHHGVRSSVYSLENPPHVDRDRARRLGPDPTNYRITNGPLDLADPLQVEMLVERERAWGTNVLLIDTYSHAFNSMRTDDGNARAIAFAQVVRYVMHELNEQGLTVVVIDHTGYMNREEPRDASAKRQQVDVAFLMEKVGEWAPGTDRASFTIRNFKSARFANPTPEGGLQGSIVGAKGEALRVDWHHEDLFGRWLA